MRVNYRDPLIPMQDIDEFVNETVLPRWVKYGGLVAGAALVLARLGGIAYADDGHGHSGDHDHDVPHHATHAGVGLHAGNDSSPAAVQAANATSVRGEERGDAHGRKLGEAVSNDDHNRHGPGVTAAKTAAASAVSVKGAATAAASETAGTVQGDTAIRPAAAVAGATTSNTANSPAGVTAAANETAGTANAATPAGSETAAVVAGANIAATPAAAQTAGTVAGDTAVTSLTRLSPRAS